jgi:sensor histidine kinase regulating citrate/malate metabolism
MWVASYSRSTLQEQSLKVGQVVSYKQTVVKMVKQTRYREGTRSNTVCIRKS